MLCEAMAVWVESLTMNRTYSELIQLKTFKERYEYLRLGGQVGADTFGFDRYLNQKFYHQDPRWRSARDKVIIRDKINSIKTINTTIISYF